MLLLGAFEILASMISWNSIKNQGKEGVAEIENITRGRCGSGYGNSADFILHTESKSILYESHCNVPTTVVKGDRFIVKFLENDTSKFLIMFELQIE